MSLFLVLAVVVSMTAAAPGPTERPRIDQPEAKPGFINIGLTEGVASYYHGSRGFHGQPHIAVQDGRWTGKVKEYLNVCIRGHGCHTLPVVDYCQCYRGEDRERIVDLSIEAVRLFGLDPSDGIWPATIQKVRG